jgi:hypothetical protein
LRKLALTHDAEPGSPEKIAVLSARFILEWENLHHPDDRFLGPKAAD